MEDKVSPRYLMQLIDNINREINLCFPTKRQARAYIKKWYQSDYNWENFEMINDSQGEIDVWETLHTMEGDDLIKIAIDMGIDTPGFIPLIPFFKNELKNDYKTAYDAFQKGFKQIEADPGTALGLANSTLESIVKEILKDERISNKINGGETLYKLTQIILKEFNLLDESFPKEIKTIGNSLVAICQSIERLRSDKTHFHGKTIDDYLIDDPLFSIFVFNTVATVGLFLNSYYKTKLPKLSKPDEFDDLPF